MNNPCEFIQNIHADPLKLIKNLTLRDYYSLQDHLQSCEKCGMLLNEVLEKYKNVGPRSSPWEQTKYN